MATNLRLQRDAEQALRAEAERTGQSQQALIRAAVDQYLGLTSESTPRSASETLVADGLVRPVRSAFREVDEPIELPDGMTTADLLDRDDRF